MIECLILLRQIRINLSSAITQLYNLMRKCSRKKNTCKYTEESFCLRAHLKVQTAVRITVNLLTGRNSEAHAAFAAMVHCIDDYVGDIVDQLETLGIQNNTMIVFTLDNGPHSEAGHDPEYFNSNGPYRGKKRDLYEGGIRVPMIVKWPSVVAANSRSDHISAFWDVFPTLAEITCQSVPENIDGISFLPTLYGSNEQEQHDYLYWEFLRIKGST